MKFSLNILMQLLEIYTDSENFGRTTMPAHHGEGLLIGEITPIDSTCFSLSRALLCNDSGTFLVNVRFNRIFAHDQLCASIQIPK